MARLTPDCGAEIEIRGLVIPAAWNGNERVAAVVISGYDEREHPVARGGKGDELLALVQREVTVRGRLKLEQGRRILEIEDYQVSGR